MTANIQIMTLLGKVFTSVDGVSALIVIALLSAIAAIMNIVKKAQKL